MIKQKTLLINIFTHNRNDALALNLMGLYNQSYMNFDILIIDDFSKKPTEKDPLIGLMKKRFEMEGVKFTIIRTNKNNGIAKNRAIMMPQLKKYDYVFDLNDDHSLDHRCIEVMIRTLNDESVCAVGSATPMFFWEPKRRYRFYRGQHLNALFINVQGLQLHRDVDYIYLSNHYEIVNDPIEVCHLSQFMYKTKYIKTEELPTTLSVLGFGEETWLSLTLKKNSGLKLMFQPNAINWHLQLITGGIREVNKTRWVKMMSSDHKKFVATWERWIKCNQNDWPQKGHINKWWEKDLPGLKILKERGLA